MSLMDVKKRYNYQGGEKPLSGDTVTWTDMNDHEYKDVVGKTGVVVEGTTKVGTIGVKFGNTVRYGFACRMVLVSREGNPDPQKVDWDIESKDGDELRFYYETNVAPEVGDKVELLTEYRGLSQGVQGTVLSWDGNLVYTSFYGEERKRLIFPWRMKKVEGAQIINDGTLSAEDLKAHGGPSAYYDFPFSEWATVNDMMEHLAEHKWGKYGIHLKDIFKGLCRWNTKDGTSAEYDTRKVIYYGVRVLKMIVGTEKTREYLNELLNDKQFGG